MRFPAEISEVPACTAAPRMTSAKSSQSAEAASKAAGETPERRMERAAAGHKRTKSVAPTVNMRSDVKQGHHSPRKEEPGPSFPFAGTVRKNDQQKEKKKYVQHVCASFSTKHDCFADQDTKKTCTMISHVQVLPFHLDRMPTGIG